MTTTDPSVAAAPAERQVSVQGVIGRYRNLLADANERAIVAEVRAEDAEAEASTLRLRVAELEDAAR